MALNVYIQVDQLIVGADLKRFYAQMLECGVQYSICFSV